MCSSVSQWMQPLVDVTVFGKFSPRNIEVSGRLRLSAVAVINRLLGEDKTVSAVGFQIDEFDVGGRHPGGILQSIQTGLKIIGDINVGRPLIAARVKETGRFVPQ